MKIVESTPDTFPRDWIIEQRESSTLTNIAGMLVTQGGLGIIAVSTWLTESEKQRTRATLHRRLADIPVGCATVMLI